MARIKAFTLVEFFATLAVFAVLAAILTPVTARAKQAATGATTVSNLRTIGLASLAYAADYDDQVVQSQQGVLDTKHYWSVSLLPYVASRSVFFDPTRPVPTGATVSLQGMALPWYQMTTIGINDGGYTSHYVSLGNTCTGRRITFQYGGRTINGMMEPNKRVAFAPTTYGGTTLGWSKLSNYQSNWVNPSAAATVFSAANEVYNTNTLYANHLIPVVHADGSAGTLSGADFKTTADTPNITAYCAWMSTEGQRTWGPFWSTN